MIFGRTHSLAHHVLPFASFFLLRIALPQPGFPPPRAPTHSLSLRAPPRSSLPRTRLHALFSAPSPGQRVTAPASQRDRECAACRRCSLPPSSLAPLRPTLLPSHHHALRAPHRRRGQRRGSDEVGGEGSISKASLPLSPPLDLDLSPPPILLRLLLVLVLLPLWI
jgi:hypothetical protein